MMDKTTSTTIIDLKLKVAEHILAQADNRKTSVQDILAENKVGIQQKSDLVRMLKGIFSVS
jgi:hypothetical protein